MYRIDRIRGELRPYPAHPVHRCSFRTRWGRATERHGMARKGQKVRIRGWPQMTCGGATLVVARTRVWAIACQLLTWYNVSRQVQSRSRLHRTRLGGEDDFLLDQV
jgi:hypothetical protein